MNRFKPKSEFSRNVLTLMTGTTIAQAIPIAISPILTRIYTPEDFGVLAIFVAVASIFGSIANARYELAIMLPKKDEDAINIFALGFIITTSISLVLLILVMLFNDYFTLLLGNDEIGLWLYFVPIAVFFIGVFNILNYFNNRKKNYKDIANATIIKSIILTVIQLSVGFLKQGAAGLISGQIISNLFANLRLLKNITKDKVLVSKISKVKMIALAKKYKDFPKFSTWAGLLNTSSQHLTNILISSFYSVATLGFYSLVQRVLGVPSTLIGGAMKQVLYEVATKEKQKTGKSIQSFNGAAKKLIMIGLPSFGILFFVVEDIFYFVFGEEWKIAGTYARTIIPLYFIHFISFPLASMMFVFEKQKASLIINTILIIAVSLVIYISKVLSLSFIEFLQLFTAIMSINYISFIIYFKILSTGGSYK